MSEKSRDYYKAVLLAKCNIISVTKKLENNRDLIFFCIFLSFTGFTFLNVHEINLQYLKFVYNLFIQRL